MYKKLFIVSVILLTSISISFADSEPNIKEGKWEITVKMEMEGMPMSMPAMTHTQCLTKDDYVPKNAQPGQECEIFDTKISGNTVTWSMKCKGQGGEMKGTGKITYKGDTFSGEMIISMTGDDMKITNKMSGRRIGPCN